MVGWGLRTGTIEITAPTSKGTWKTWDKASAVVPSTAVPRGCSRSREERLQCLGVGHRDCKEESLPEAFIRCNPCNLLDQPQREEKNPCLFLGCYFE